MVVTGTLHLHLSDLGRYIAHLSLLLVNCVDDAWYYHSRIAGLYDIGCCCCQMSCKKILSMYLAVSLITHTCTMTQNSVTLYTVVTGDPVESESAQSPDFYFTNKSTLAAINRITVCVFRE